MILAKIIDKGKHTVLVNLDEVATVETNPNYPNYVTFRLNSGNTIQLETTLDDVMAAIKTAIR